MSRRTSRGTSASTTSPAISERFCVPELGGFEKRFCSSSTSSKSCTRWSPTRASAWPLPHVWLQWPTMSRPPLRMVLSIRSDFVDRVAEDRQFMAELTQSLFFLTPPDRAGLREALVRPAEMAGYRFENERMIEHMLGSLQSTSGALPLLQFAATRLWETRDTARRLLTEQSYANIGGLEGALASHADAVMVGLSPQAKLLVKTIFQRLVTPDRTRALASIPELRELTSFPDEIERLVYQLVDARLLLVQQGDGAEGSSVEIVHESLLHTWPTLRRWLDESQEDSAFLHQLRSVAKQWDARGRPNGLLWRGEAMEEARLWYRRYTGQLPEVQKAYLDAVLSAARRQGQRRRLIVTVIIAFLTLAVAAAAIALVQIRDAEQKANQQADAARQAEKEASQQAQVAREAERKVRDQLTVIQEKEQARLRAEKKVAAANTQVEMSKEELERANKRLRRALEDSEEAKTELAEALDEAKKAREKTKKLLTQEKKRVKELEDRIGKVGGKLK